jgi:hypothetical protein
MISSAQLNNTPVEVLVTEIADRVTVEDGYLFVHNIHPLNIDQSNPMQRVIPSFSAFIRNPMTMDREFRTEKVVEGTQIRAKSKLYPEFKECVIEAHSYSHDVTEAQKSYAFKRRCDESFFRGNKSVAEVTADLLRLTWQAFEVITTEGPAEAHRQFYSEERDDRLSHGVINPLTAEKNLRLASGARVRMEVGDTVACITTQALDSDESASFSWMILAKNGALSPLDSRLITARTAVDKLVHGSAAEKLEAIATLDRMAHKAPMKTPSLESLVGYETADALRRLDNTKIEMGEPRSEIRMLDNLAGMQHVEFTFRDPGHNRHRPQDPRYMCLGYGCDGDLKIEAWNPLNNHVSTHISPTVAEQFGGIEKITLRLARLFNQQTESSFLQLRALIENLAAASSIPSIEPERLPLESRRMPSSRDIALSGAYGMVAEIAKMYQAVTEASFSEFKVSKQFNELYDVEFSNQFAGKKTALHCCVSQHGIKRLEIFHENGGAIEAEAFSFEKPLNIKANESEIMAIFADFNAITPFHEDSASKPLPCVTSTALYARLKSLDDREAIFG